MPDAGGDASKGGRKHFIFIFIHICFLFFLSFIAFFGRFVARGVQKHEGKKIPKKPIWAHHKKCGFFFLRPPPPSPPLFVVLLDFFYHAFGRFVTRGVKKRD
jgi:hypothetical protein